MSSATTKPANAAQRDQIFYAFEDTLRDVRVEADRQRLLNEAKLIAITKGKSVGEFVWPSFDDRWRDFHYEEKRIGCEILINYRTRCDPPGRLSYEELTITRVGVRDGMLETTRIEARPTHLGIWTYTVTYTGEEKLLREQPPIPG